MDKKPINSIEEILTPLFRAKNILITSHVSPEGDNVGSCLGLYHGLCKMGKTANVWLKDGVPDYLRFLAGADGILKGDYSFDLSYDTLVVVDCGELDRIGKSSIRPITEKATVVNIDHHATNDFFGNANWVDPNASATGELIYRLLRKARVELDADIAQCLYAAISADTGSFKYSNTTSEALVVASELVKYGAKPEIVGRALFSYFPKEKIMLMSDVFSTLELYDDDQIAIVCVYLSMFEKTNAKPEHTEGLIDTVRNIPGVEVACFFREVDTSRTKISLRSNGRIDVARVCKIFGGGGHSMAAGAVMEADVSRTKQHVVKTLVATLN